MESDEELENNSRPTTPEFLVEQSIDASERALPKKSKAIYKATYKHFMAWRVANGTTSFSQRVLLAYFNELGKKYKPSTLWSEYSKLRAMLDDREKIDISRYTELRGYLRSKAKGFKSRKSKVLTSNQIKTFLNDASDLVYLATKAATIIRVFGGCRKDELLDLSPNDINTYFADHDVEKKNPMALVNIRRTKIGKPRTFTVTGKFFKILKKYMNLRPKNTMINRFFLNYQAGKCTRQPIGRNKFDQMPKDIARFLKLENPESYTGLCFRKTSGTSLVDSATDKHELNRLTRLKSNTVVISSAGSPNHTRVIKLTKSINQEKFTTNIEKNTTSSDSPQMINLLVLKQDPLFQNTNGNSLYIGNCSNEIINSDVNDNDNHHEGEIARNVSPEQVLCSSESSQETVYSDSAVDPLDTNKSDTKKQDKRKQDTNKLDDNYHFVMSLLPHIRKLSEERRMLLRMQIQELVYKTVYKL